MSVAETIALGLALGADSLSVCIGIGMGGMRWYRLLKLAMLFSVTQGVLLVGGARLAFALHLWLESFLAARCLPAHTLHTTLSLLGAVILIAVGVNLIRDYMVRRGEGGPVYYRGRAALLLLALSVSIDAFSSGVGLGMSEVKSLVEIGFGVTAVIFLMSLFGLRAGRRIGRLVGRAAEPLGGIVLLVLAARAIVEALA